MLRICDVVISILGIIICTPILIFIYCINFFEIKSPLFFQVRIGYRQKLFLLIKFRTMKLDTTSIATHMVDVSAITPFGRILRKTKLDELPQLYNVLIGDMSLVGPRPCLPNQRELITERAKRHVFDARPGITGLAQVKGIDMSTPELLAITDARMLSSLTVISYFGYMFKTLFSFLKKE